MEILRNKSIAQIAYINKSLKLLKMLIVNIVIGDSD